MSRRIPIGPKYLEKPITQGGMGVGVPLGNLAGAIMKEDGMGVISAAYPGYRKENFWRDPLACNIEAVYGEVAEVRVTSGGRGLLDVNVMVASHHYEDYVKVVTGAGVDVIIPDAGILISLPPVEGSDQVALVPIVSSGHAARLILRSWDRHYHRCPDLVAVEEGPTGGHPSFKKEELLSGRVKELSELVCEILQEMRTYEKLYQTSISIFTADGAYTREDITALLNISASGVQMTTCFIATTGCDVDLTFKQRIVNARKEDITLVTSPAGLPDCAVMTAFMRNALKGRITSEHYINCMKPCVPASTPYCISDAPVHLVEDDVEDGLVFVGVNAWRVADIVSVYDLMAEPCV